MRIHLQGAKRPLAVTAATAIAALGIVAPAAAAPNDEDRETTAVVDTPAPESDAPVEEDTQDETPAQTAPPADDGDEAVPEAEESGTDDVTPPADSPVTIDILGITDFHGYIENMPFMQTQFSAIRTANPNTIFATAGDNIGGSAFVSSIAKDVPTIDVLNAMNLEVSAVGNHEFDKGYADLRDRVIPLANFEYLGANVGGAPEINEPPVWVKNIDGVDVAFIGTVTETTPSIVSIGGIAGLSFSDPVAKTNEVAARYKDGDPANGEADVVVSLFHEGDSVAVGMSDAVDLVFAGHTHIQNVSETSAGAPIIQAGQYGEAFGHATLTVSEGGVTVDEAKIVALDKSVAPDPTVQAIVNDAKDQALELGAEVIAEITENAYRGTNDGTNMGANRGTESSMGNHLANAALMTVNSTAVGADFGIINPGGVRADMDQNDNGEVTFGEAYTTQPFGNTVGSIDLTGEQVYTMLEQQFQPEASRPVLRLGLSDNVTYTYNPLAADGGDIMGIWIDGVPVDRAATYTVASNTFLLGGQDGFTVFRDGTNFRETGIVDLEGYINYLEAGKADVIPKGQRSIGLQSNLVSGKMSTVDLWSLTFTALEQKPSTAKLYLNGTEVGSAPIDTSVTPNRDNTGSAQVRFAVPANAPASSELRIVTTFEGGAVDTDVTVPVTVSPAPVPSVGNWFYVSNDWTSTIADTEFSFGRAGDEVFVGDWDGDGDDTFAVRRGTTFFVTNELKGGNAEKSFIYGRAGDEVIVGDWDGDGKDTFGVRRGNTFYLMNELKAGHADIQFNYGRVGDEVFTGDWDKDDVDTITVRRGNTFFVNNKLVGGYATTFFDYGRMGDMALAGDFNGDGYDTISVRRGNVFFINNALEGGPADLELGYGRVGDDVFVGDWNGDGVDTPAVRR
ncbi:bifunctional metallophosphatase/5'-nucleotidase [Flaviflexus huanghaiensis]|uniref:bifunctional metallophosphatase/5'-nucleotidase n=1 Tax=Flaviflexus huanghaiensis TaxID=1111473 RepID=UPI0015FBC944|nr:5'-nucleotidase C-terminal domain-containing protein [Flaviflexus huanghaiensis]